MKIAVLDSDTENLKVWNSFVSKGDSNNKVWCYETVFSLVTGIYDEHSGDIDLLIIRATDETFEMAMDVHSFFPHILIVFYSDNPQMVERTFEVDPIYFFILPLNAERIEKVIKKANDKIKSISGKSLVIINRGRMVKLRYTSIKYIESEGRKVLIHTDDGFYDTYMKMDDIQEKLPKYFYRCHRCYIVNLDRISGMNSTDVILSSRERIPVSRSRLLPLKRSFVIKNT